MLACRVEPEKNAVSGDAGPVKGTRPEGAATEADISRKVREMFSQIAPRYDLLNHLLSLQIDRIWRARVVRRVAPILRRRDAAVLDVCCGTGDLTLGLARGGNATVIGADFAHPMLVRAQTKGAALKNGARDPGSREISFIEADALHLPFADASFDLVTTAFGFRNLANYDAGLREFHRVLKPAGTLAILEFTEPPAGVIGNLYRWYFRSVLPRIGGAISGDSAAYTYLPQSVARFFRPAELATAMAGIGYKTVEYSVWTLGTVALHTGIKG